MCYVTSKKANFMWNEGLSRKRFKTKGSDIKTTTGIQWCHPQENTFYVHQRNIRKTFQNQRLGYQQTLLTCPCYANPKEKIQTKGISQSISRPKI